MSTLSKVFVVLNLILGLLFLGVAVTLFATRLDWKAKFFTEVTKHHTDVNYYLGELAEKESLVHNYELDVRVLTSKISTLQTENNQLITQRQETETKYNQVLNELNELQNHQRAFVNQLQVLEKAKEDLMAQIDLFRDKLGVASQERDTVIAQLQEEKFRNEELTKDISQIEKNYVDMAYQNHEKELVLAELAKRGFDVNSIIPGGVAPKELVEGRVQAVSPKYNLAVLSVGRDDGVSLGDYFTVYRGSEFVSKVVVEKLEKDWCSARVAEGFSVDKIEVGDNASNKIYR